MSHLNYGNPPKSRKVLNTQYIFRKREPAKPQSGKADVYISNKSNFKYNLERIEKLWNQEESEITVRALGAAIPRAINVCLQFQKNHFNVLDLEVTTNTVNLVDDFEPLNDDDDYETLTRRNSSICIKIIRKISVSSR